jgi:PKD repeat protein
MLRRLVIKFGRLTAVLALVVGGLWTTGAQTPPSFPPSVAGQRQIIWNYSGLRPISPVPPIGVHPRIFVGPDERAAVCSRLTNTWAGQEIFTNYIQRYTALLKNPRSIYDSLPNSIKLMPDGSARLGNVGFYNDPYTYYTNMVAGQTNNIDALITARNGTFCRTMAGELALEALECWVLQGQAGVAQRATNLAVAMDTWATYLLSRSDFAQSTSTTAAAVNWMLGGGAAFAEAYDFNFWAMNSNQCAHVRSAIARVMYAAPYQGVTVSPEADVSNWVSLDGFQLIMAMALEGETSAAVEGFDTNYFNAYFTNAMGSFYKFLTYGWHPTGEMYEGMGKGWFGGARLIGFAKRGYNFFGHPHLINYLKNDWPACLQPFGYSWSHYDLIGGEGTDNLRGGRLYTAEDQIAMQWVYTNYPAAAFLWRNFVMTDWCSNSPAAGTNNYKFFLDFRDSKFVVSSVYGQDLLEAALFVQDPVTNVDWNVQNAAIRTNLDFVDTCGSTIVGRSDYSSNAVSLQFHTRQDFGGHTYAERGGFAISGLGRVWVWFPYSLSYGQPSAFSSQILVDDVGAYVTPQEGDKMRIPAKLAAWSSRSNALFATCDATYCYTWGWKWNNFTNTGSMTVDSGYQKETNCFNTFRRSDNQIPEAYGNTPFWQYPHWLNGGWLEGIERISYNPMRQVIRTAGLVRGAKPYVLVADDIQKDGNSHVYKWLLQIPGDLTLATGAALPTGFNANTDCVLNENPTNGSRGLLVRILSPTNWAAYTDVTNNFFYVNSTNTQEFFPRLVVVTTNIAPAFKVLLYPFKAGDLLPTNVWTATNVLTVSIGNQTDTFTFSPRAYTTTDGRAISLSEFQLSRGGTNLLDYRNQIEPFAASVPIVAGFTATPTNGLSPLTVSFKDVSTGLVVTNRQWDFGDGTGLSTNMAMSLTHTYTNPGAYSVQLVVRGQSGSSTNLVTNCVVVLPTSTPPVIGGISLVGTNLIVTGTNGVAGANCFLLAATNLLLPLTNWNIIATNQFGAGGTASMTNPLNPNASQIYYRLWLP